ncbi:unnamed protein product [Paramecium sonneborni]|uniref:Uncharacterized protein n=1 Tax=Paramecium sonneborni TaxID=65129 RepID=A0A8S1QW22_9CILI|nr:unnamed protein product [Paramecium sonneborni]
MTMRLNQNDLGFLLMKLQKMKQKNLTELKYYKKSNQLKNQKDLLYELNLPKDNQARIEERAKEVDVSEKKVIEKII